MTDQNNAAQAAEQAIKAAIRKAYDDGYNDAKMAPDNCSTYCVERAVRLDSAALQSALRAPVADERAAFEYHARACELTRDEDVPDDYRNPHVQEYWNGWKARAALASAPVAIPGNTLTGDGSGVALPVAGEAPPTDWQNALRIAELPEVDEALAVFCNDGTLDNAVGLVQAILDAAPQASEAVRIQFPAHLRKMWSGGEVQAWLDEHQGVTPPKVSAKGSLERYRKWQAEREEAFGAGVKAAADLVKKMVDDYDTDHGSTDPETGTREYPGDGAAWVCDMEELEGSIRALSAQPAQKEQHTDGGAVYE